MRFLFVILVCSTFLIGSVMGMHGAVANMPDLPMSISSPAFTAGENIPVEFTGDGDNFAPPLAWKNAPDGTKAFALVCDDPDAPMGTWVHWVLYDLPADMTALDISQAALPDGAKEGLNDFHEEGYGGPAPPPGPAHRYFFRLYALSAPTGLAAGATREQLQAAMDGHILAETQMMGTYQRNALTR